MKLSEYLDWKQMRPRAFAEEIGVPASTITRIIRGERKPGFDLMAKIAAATSNSVSSLDDFEARKRRA